MVWFRSWYIVKISLKERGCREDYCFRDCRVTSLQSIDWDLSPFPLMRCCQVVYHQEIKFIYSEKATKFCKIFTLLLTVCTVVKSKVKISQNFVAFSEYMNFTSSHCYKKWGVKVIYHVCRIFDWNYLWIWPHEKI